MLLDTTQCSVRTIIRDRGIGASHLSPRPIAASLKIEIWQFGLSRRVNDADLLANRRRCYALINLSPKTR